MTNVCLVFSLAVSNDSVEHLDLSWNLLRKKAASEISNGLRVGLVFKYTSIYHPFIHT